MSRIERWTRNLLEAEARKRGVRDPELHSRTELLRAIVEHDYGPRRSLRNARKLVGNLLDGAAQAFPLLSSLRDKPDARHLGPSSLPTPSQSAQSTLPSTPAAPSSLQLRREPSQLELSWQVNPQDVERARRLLGEPGELSLRVVCVQADPAQVVRSEVTEHGPLDPQGSWTLHLAGPECSCVGSVGVRHGDRFVSIAHQSSRVAHAGQQPAQPTVNA